MIRKANTKRVLRNRVCMFCTEGILPDYKDAVRLKRFLSERGKIIGSQRTGTCTRHQRQLTTALKRARFLALLPYTSRI